MALLLQGGAGEFADTNHAHPSQWGNVNIIPTIIRSSEHVGIHWVLVEIIMTCRKIRLYDPIGMRKDYQQTILDVISQTLLEEVTPRGVWNTQIVDGMDRQIDSFNCGVFVTAWAESAKRGGKVENCLRAGDEKSFRKKMYKVLTDNWGGGIGEKIEVTINNNSCEEGNTSEFHIEKCLDKYLKNKTIILMRKMIGLGTAIFKEYRKVLLDLINGYCKEKESIKFTNYVASDEYNDAPEEV